MIDHKCFTTYRLMFLLLKIEILILMEIIRIRIGRLDSIIKPNLSHEFLDQLDDVIFYFKASPIVDRT